VEWANCHLVSKTVTSMRAALFDLQPEAAPGSEGSAARHPQPVVCVVRPSIPQQWAMSITIATWRMRIHDRRRPERI